VEPEPTLKNGAVLKSLMSRKFNMLSMKKIAKLLTLILLVSTAIINTGCKKDEPEPPVASFTFSGDNKPAPCEVLFSNSSTNANTYLWNFGDGTSSTEQNTKHVYSAGGSYVVTLTAKGDGGSHSIEKTLYVKMQMPIADFSFTGDDFPAPCDVTFSNTTTFGTSFIWEFGDGATSTEKNVTHTFIEGGTYNVKLIAIGEGGSNSIIKQVIVAYPPPVADFSYSGNNTPAPCNLSFYNNTINATSYYWDFGDGFTSTEHSPDHVFVDGGTYNVKLTAYGNGGSDYITRSVTIEYPSFGTDVTFYNPTYTIIYVSLNGTTQAIYTGSSVTFYSVPGSSASYYAYTNGKTTSGSQVGLLIEWSNTISLPGGSLSYNLIITNDYFFLYIKNDGTHTLTPIYVNYGAWNETIDYVLVPANGIKYRLGYYRAYSNTEVRGYYDDAPSYYTYWYNLNFPWTENQSVELNNSFKSRNGIDNSHTKGQASQSLFPVENIRKAINYNEKAINVKCK